LKLRVTRSAAVSAELRATKAKVTRAATRVRREQGRLMPGSWVLGERRARAAMLTPLMSVRVYSST